MNLLLHIWLNNQDIHSTTVLYLNIIFYDLSTVGWLYLYPCFRFELKQILKVWCKCCTWVVTVFQLSSHPRYQQKYIAGCGGPGGSGAGRVLSSIFYITKIPVFRSPTQSCLWLLIMASRMRGKKMIRHIWPKEDLGDFQLLLIIYVHVLNVIPRTSCHKGYRYKYLLMYNSLSEKSRLHWNRFNETVIDFSTWSFFYLAFILNMY